MPSVVKKQQRHGFNCSTLTCGTMRLDQWTAIFGPETDALPEEEDTVQAHYEAVEVSKDSTSSESTCSVLDLSEEQECDPQFCSMDTGFCVDCTRCAQHCSCNDDKVQKEEEPPICDPHTCRQLICGDCLRCTDHCVCHFEYSTLKAPSSNNRSRPPQPRLQNRADIDDALFLSNEKRLVYSYLMDDP